ncbi:MAG: glycosyltransferase family 4 protein [Phycisphaeraceae bacterium]
MRIRIFHAFLHPDKSAVSQIISDVAFDLVKHGHEVEGISGTGLYAGGDAKLLRRETVEGVHFRRVPTPHYQSRSRLTRLWSMTSYTIGSVALALCSRRADRTIVLTNPPVLPLTGTLLWLLRRERYVYVVMDLYPDIVTAAGHLPSGGWIARIGRGVTRLALNKAWRVVVLGECMADKIGNYGISRDKIRIIRNWNDEQAVRPIPPADNPLRRELNLGDKFVVMYSGNMGVGHRFDDILEAARRLRDRDDIHFLFVGGGSRRPQVEQFAAEHQLSNVTVRPYFDREQLGQSLAIGDAHFVSLREGFEGLIVPSKAYGVMAAGRAMLYQGHPTGEIAQMVTQHEAGRVVREGDVEAMCRTIRAWADDRAFVVKLGANARCAFEEHYAMAQGLNAYRQVLEEQA